METGRRMMRHLHIVDADARSRDALRARLGGRADLIVRPFASAAAFLAAQAEIDGGVLLLDIDGADSSAALATIDERHAPVVLSRRRDVALAVAAMKAGALDFVDPDASDRLLAAMDDAFAALERRHTASGRARAARAKITNLSPREGDVLRGLIEGRANKAIASELDLSPRTVEIHRARLMEKLDVRSLSEVLGIAFAAGMFGRDAVAAPPRRVPERREA